jgi:hypothetical protein
VARESREIFHRDTWYFPLSSQSIYESEYESSIKRYAENLFPGFWCGSFTELVKSEYGDSKPDLVLVDKQYRRWIVVEVELEHHSLYGHIEPQMRCLSYGTYGEAHASKIATTLVESDFERLALMVRTVDPEFLVISPVIPEKWIGPLTMLGVKTCSIEIFINNRDERLLVAEGSRPVSDPEEFVSVIEPDAFYPRAYKVLTPSALQGENSLQINYEGQVTTWKIIRATNTILISPTGTLSLSQGCFMLERDSDQRFWITKENL